MARRIGVEIGVRPAGQRASQAPPARRRRATCGRSRNGRRRARPRFPSRECAATGPSSRSRRPGPTARMSQTVRISSSRSRSSVCTIAASASAVFGSERSRPCAMFDMIRCCSTSQATRSVSAAREAEPRRQLARDFGAGDRMVLLAALGDVVQERGEIERRAMADRRQDLAGERMLLLEPARFDLGSGCRPCAADARRPCSGGTC